MLLQLEIAHRLLVDVRNGLQELLLRLKNLGLVSVSFFHQLLVLQLLLLHLSLKNLIQLVSFVQSIGLLQLLYFLLLFEQLFFLVLNLGLQRLVEYFDALVFLAETLHSLLHQNQLVFLHEVPFQILNLFFESLDLLHPLESVLDLWLMRIQLVDVVVQDCAFPNKLHPRGNVDFVLRNHFSSKRKVRGRSVFVQVDQVLGGGKVGRILFEGTSGCFLELQNVRGNGRDVLVVDFEVSFRKSIVALLQVQPGNLLDRK